MPKRKTLAIATLSSGKTVEVQISLQTSAHAMFLEIRDKVKALGNRRKVVSWDWKDVDQTFPALAPLPMVEKACPGIDAPGLVGRTFVSPLHASGVEWRVLRYHRGGAWVCEEQQHKTTCHFYEAQILEWSRPRVATPPGFSHISRQPWHKDRAKTEVWGSKDGKNWILLGIE